MSAKNQVSQEDALQLAQIVAYYRNRVDAFEADRQSFFEKLNQIRLKQELVYKSEWDLKKRLEEKQHL